MIKDLFRRLRLIAMRLAGNRTGQRILERITHECQLAMGMGFGSAVGESGEIAVIKKVGLMLPEKQLVVFDVGANVGMFARELKRNWPDRAWTCHCFEPSRATFARLSVEVAGDPRFKLENCGLSAQEGRFKLYSDSELSGSASLSKRNLDHLGVNFSLEEEVAVTTLAAYCERQKIEAIDLLKVDVEGHEFAVLQGGREFISDRRINAVLFEFGGTHIDTRIFFKDYYYLFEGCGYTLFRVTPSGYLRKIERYEEVHEHFRATNFFAVPQKFAPALE